MQTRMTVPAAPVIGTIWDSGIRCARSARSARPLRPRLQAFSGWHSCCRCVAVITWAWAEDRPSHLAVVSTKNSSVLELLVILSVLNTPQESWSFHFCFEHRGKNQ